MIGLFKKKIAAQSSSPLQSPLSERFGEVFLQNSWGDEESVSGAGSRLDSHSVQAAIKALDHVIRTYDIKTVADIPCGDFNWIPLILGRNPTIKYQGCDISSLLIERNKARYPFYDFKCLDVTLEIPPAVDLIFCKDMVNHLLYADVAKCLINIKASGSRYLMLSNNFGWTNVELPEDGPGSSRHLDITAEPLAFPAPVWSTDYLGLWHLPDIDEGSFDKLRMLL